MTPDLLQLAEPVPHRAHPLHPDISLQIYTLNGTCVAYRPPGPLTRTHMICLPWQDKPAQNESDAASTDSPHTWLNYASTMLWRRTNDVCNYVYRVTGWNLAWSARIPVYAVRTLRSALRLVAVLLSAASATVDLGAALLNIAG